MFDSQTTRRDFLKAGGQAALAAAMLGSGLCDGKAAADAVAPKAKALAPKAKKLIFIFLEGAPPQTATFDPKPENNGRIGPKGLPYNEDYHRAIPTNVPGIQVSESLPMLAKLADKYSLIRSMRNYTGDHRTDAYPALTATLPDPDMIRPTCTTVAGLKLADPKLTVPPYILLTNLDYLETGMLGPQFGPFVADGDPSQPDFYSGLALSPSVSLERSHRRRRLLESLNALKDDRFRESLQYQERVFQQILEDNRQTFDLAREKREVRERYGMTWAGQSMLLARRLLEADNGAKVVKVNWNNNSTNGVGAWDFHHAGFGIASVLIPVLDRALSALVEDLAQRGLLEETVLLCGGEFGRTPYMTVPVHGTEHWPFSYSWLVAGGGFKGGCVVGKTNREAYITERPVYPWDLWRSVYHLLGINPDDKLPSPPGRCNDTRILPPPPTADEFFPWHGREKHMAEYKKNKDMRPEIYVTPFLDPGARVSGGLLTEIMS